MKILRYFFMLVFVLCFFIGCANQAADVQDALTYAVPAGTYSVTISQFTGDVKNGSGAGSNGTFTVNADGSFSFSGDANFGAGSESVSFAGTMTMTGPASGSGTLTSFSPDGTTPCSGTFSITSTAFQFTSSITIQLTYN